MPKVTVSLRSIFYYKYDRSTLSFDPEALEGRPSKGGSRRVEFLKFRHFRSFLILAHLLLSWVNSKV